MKISQFLLRNFKYSAKKLFTPSNLQRTLVLGGALTFMYYQSPIIMRMRTQAISKSADPYKRSRAKTKIGQDAVIICGNANRNLAESVGNYLGTKLAPSKVQRFADGEVLVKIDQSVSGKHCYIVQSTCPPVNDSLMELILMISACRRAGAASVTCIVPYYGYARQDRRGPNWTVPISGADVAQILELMGADRIVSVDLHCTQTQGFVSPRVAFDNYEAAFIGLSYFLREIKDKSQIVVVSPDAGGAKRAEQFHAHFAYHGYGGQVGLAVMSKERKEANKVEKIDLVGNVEGKICILVDDMIDTAGTLCEAAKVLKQKGAKQIYAFATHGLFSGPAAERIANSDLTKVITTDSIPVTKQFKEKVGNKHEEVSLGLMVAEIIRRVHLKEDTRDLFDIPLY